MALCYQPSLVKARDMKRLSMKLSFQEHLDICTQHLFNSIHCILEDWAEDKIVVRIENYSAFKP